MLTTAALWLKHEHRLEESDYDIYDIHTIRFISQDATNTHFDWLHVLRYITWRICCLLAWLKRTHLITHKHCYCSSPNQLSALKGNYPIIKSISRGRVSFLKRRCFYAPALARELRTWSGGFFTSNATLGQLPSRALYEPIN